MDEQQRGHLLIGSFIHKLNTVWHKPANQIFIVIILAHWSEHVMQAFQVYALNHPRVHSHGLIGQWVPWLNTSEWLHYGYAVVILVALILLQPGFIGRSRVWWNIALGIQLWHFLEHALLLMQAGLDMTFFGSAEKSSILQLLIPRVELHLFYNAMVSIPMAVAMWYHCFTNPAEQTCLCSRIGRIGSIRDSEGSQGNGTDQVLESS